MVIVCFITNFHSLSYVYDGQMKFLHIAELEILLVSI